VSGSPRRPGATGRPNILWLCTDQQRYDTLGAQGNRHVRTPRLDELWRSGTAFTHAYCQSPICTPSRASFLTGTYPSTCHNTRNGNDTFSGRFPLVTRLLADAGYDCGLIGKLHLASAYGRIEPRTDDGYRYWRYSHGPRDDWPVGHDYADWVRERGSVLGELIQDPAGVPAPLHQTTWCAERTIEFITDEQRPADTPWMACVNIYDPHPPFNPPQEYRDRYDPAAMPGPLFRASDLAQQERLAAVDFQSRGRQPDDLDIGSPVIPVAPRPEGSEAIESSVVPSAMLAHATARDARTLQAAYYAMIELIDDQVARVLDALQTSGQADNTLVIFTSDHGEMLGDHGLIQKGCRFYEGLVRVPLILSWPGRIGAGQQSDALVELTDLAPTLLEAAGEPVPEWMQGRSLLPLSCGDAPLDRHRDAVWCEYFDALDAPDATRATMYRRGHYKLVVYHGHGLGELYDLERDPGEFDNLWDDPEHAALKSELLVESYAAAMATVDVGTPRVGPM
jgi:arylsulfatase A-like enzyme